MTPPGNDISAQLERYLDGQLSGPDLDAFERRLRADPALRAQVQLQHRLDSTLQTLCAPPEGLALACPTASAAGAPTTGSPLVRRRRAVALAASLLLAATALLFISRAVGWPAFGLEKLYRHEVAGGLTPDWICETDEQMAAYLTEKFGQGMLVASARPGVELIGWSRAPIITHYTGVLLTRVDGEPTIVLVDRLVHDRGLTLPPLSPLHIFRREVGTLVVYEITPDDAPRVIPLFSPPPA